MPAGLNHFKLSIIIPVYNEEELITQVVERVKSSVRKQGLNAEIIVVNDGSKDRSAEAIRKINGITFVNLKQNAGKGGAVKAGFKAATGDIYLIQDSDLEYDPDDYTSVISPIVEGRCKVTMGSRFLKERPVFWGKRKSPYFSHYIGNRLIILVTNLLYFVHATDYEGCYKAFRSDVIKSIKVNSDGFKYDNELICKILKRGSKIIEVPIKYSPRSYESGKKINWKHGVKMLWATLKYRFYD